METGRGPVKPRRKKRLFIRDYGVFAKAASAVRGTEFVRRAWRASFRAARDAITAYIVRAVEDEATTK